MNTYFDPLMLRESEQEQLVSKSTFRSSRNDDIEQSVVRSLFGEFFASFFYVYVTSAALCISSLMEKLGRTLFVSIASVSLTYYMNDVTIIGMTWMIVLYSFSFPSGKKLSAAETRHISPTISLGFIINFIFQIAGALAAVVILGFLFLTLPHEKSFHAVFVLEAVLTFIFVTVVLALVFSSFISSEGMVYLKEHTPQSFHEQNCIITGAFVMISSAIGSLINPILATVLLLLDKKVNEYMIHCWLGPLVGVVAASIADRIYH